jgi:hypothetical protein
MLEETSKRDPFYLQNLMYDRPIDISAVESVTIKITIPKNFSAYIIDDLHFAGTNNNSIEFFIEEESILTYQFFVANHKLCDLCEHKKEYDCQAIPENFEKNVSATLLQPGGKAYLKCHYLGDKNSVFKLNTHQHHLASNTTSTVSVKSVLDNAAKFVTDSTIHVEKNLKNIISEQMNKNLLLNEKAHVISTPKLNINTNEASCKHGATIGSLSEHDLFYLQSRGLDEEAAMRTLVDAFLELNQSVIDK